MVEELSVAVFSLVVELYVAVFSLVVELSVAVILLVVELSVAVISLVVELTSCFFMGCFLSVPALSTPPAFAEQRRHLERAKVSQGYLLTQLVSRRVALLL